MTRDELVRDTLRWARSRDRSAIEAAVDLLTLTPDDLRHGGEFWRLEKRANRLTTRPLMAVGDRLTWSPARARATQLVFLTYLSEGRLPWPTQPRFGPQQGASGGDAEPGFKMLQKRAARVRSERNLAIEGAVIDRASEAGWPTLGRVKMKRIPGLPGEVDVITADVDRRVVWVLEVKDLQTGFSPSPIAHQIAKIHGTAKLGHSRDQRDEVAVLEAKAAAVRDGLPHVLDLLAVEAHRNKIDVASGWADNSNSGWTVGSAFVTPDPIAAAFVEPPRGLFVLVENVPEALSVVPPTHTGYVWVPSHDQSLVLEKLRASTAAAAQHP